MGAKGLADGLTCDFSGIKFKYQVTKTGETEENYGESILINKDNT